MVIIRTGIHKKIVKIANREDPDLDLKNLSTRPFWLATHDQNFRTSTYDSFL